MGIDTKVGSKSRYLMKQNNVLKITREELYAIGALRRAAIRSFRSPWVALLLLGVTALVAFVAPRAIVTDSIVLLWVGTGALSLVSVCYQILTGPFLVVLFARQRVSVLLTLMLNSVVAVALLTYLALPAASPDYVEIHGFPSVVARIYMVLYLLSWAFIHVYLTLMERIFGNILSKANMPIQIFPQIRESTLEELQKLLPADIRGPIRYIQAQDKYVQVGTQNGSHLLSMPLSLAISQIDTRRGMRVHRSLWICWSEIDRVVYENGNPRIVGKDGTIWPVSRKHVKQVKATVQERDAG